VADLDLVRRHLYNVLKFEDKPTPTMAKEKPTIPPDDLERNLALARPNEDQTLRHIGLAGNTYVILLTGKDTSFVRRGTWSSSYNLSQR
jgi:hypothetical protein